MFFHQTCISNNVSFKDKNSSCLRKQVARQHENPRIRRCGVPPTAMDSQKPRGRMGLWGLREMFCLGGILHHSSMLKDSEEPPNDEFSKNLKSILEFLLVQKHKVVVFAVGDEWLCQHEKEDMWNKPCTPPACFPCLGKIFCGSFLNYQSREFRNGPSSISLFLARSFHSDSG